MTVQVAPGQSTTTTASLSANATPEQIAQDILYQNDPWIGSYDLPAVRQSLDALAQIDPRLAQQVETAIMAQLTPREQGELRRATYAINAGEAGSITIADNAPSVQSYFEGTASGNAAADRAFYARLDRVFGDGDPATNDVARIESGIGLLIRGDISLEQYETLRAAGVQDGVNVGEVVLDLSQMTLDIVGIFDQTGLSDGANALISAGRGDWVGAGLSVLAIVPVVGALAAAGKLGKWAETVTKAVELAANNPAARAALEPMLRRLNDAIGAIPDAVMRNLPESMRSTLEGLKTKLDDFFGVGARRLAGASLDELASGLARATGSEAVEFAQEIARRSTQGSGDRVVLGRHPGYIDEAKANGGVYFSTPDGFFEQLRNHAGDAADDKMWMVNEAFLRQQLDGGIGVVEFTTEGLEHAINRPESFSGRELRFLLNAAEEYGLVQTGTRFATNR